MVETKASTAKAAASKTNRGFVECMGVIGKQIKREVFPQRSKETFLDDVLKDD